MVIISLGGYYYYHFYIYDNIYYSTKVIRKCLSLSDKFQNTYAKFVLKYLIFNNV